MTEYFYHLFHQFNKSRGITKPDFNSKNYLDEFTQWLYIQNKIAIEYRQYLENFGFDVDDQSVAEVGKGKYDTIILPNTSIISPYAKTLGKDICELKIYQGEPIIIGSKIKEGQVVDKFMTHNPYSKKLVENWEGLHFNNYDICIGMFGGVTDKDFEDKMKILSMFKSSLTDESKFEFDEIGDAYVSFVKSKRKIKSLVNKL